MAVLTFVVPWIVGQPAAGADRLSPILQGIRDRYGGLSGLVVPYSREVVTRSMAMMGAEVKVDLAAGKIYFKPPHSLRLEQDSPTREFLITDGTTLWWYLPDQNKAYRYEQESFGKELRLLSDLFRGLPSAHERFQLTVVSEEDEGYQLELRPDPMWEQVDHMLVTLDGAYVVRGVEIHNSLGGITRFRLKPMTEKAHFETGFFRFTPPEGVQVVDGPAG
jgi:outer membrane lipoprotein carrier protein